MNYKKLIKNSFSQVVPMTSNESFERSVMERETKMNDTKKVVRKKPWVIIAVAAAVMLSVTATAAAFNFDEIFGNSKFRAENAEISSELIANVTNVETYVDNEDYAVNLKAVTGSENSFVAVVEIARKDGQPVEEYWQNAVEVEENSLIDGLNHGVMKGCNFVSETTENNALELIIDFTSVNGQLSGKEITLTNSASFRLKNNDFGKYENAQDSVKIEWWVKFIYEPSEISKTLTCEDLSERVTLYRDVEFFDNKANMEIKSLEVGSLTMIMEYEMYPNIYDIGVFFLHYPEKNSMALIKKDGTEMKVSLISHSYSSQPQKRYTATFAYADSPYSWYSDSDKVLVINLDEIESLRINDKIYKLS